MYIAINRKLLRINPVKALRFAIRRETVLDILMEVSKKKIQKIIQLYMLSNS